MPKAKETKYWLEAKLCDGSKLEGTLTHHKMLSRAKCTHRYSIDFGNLQESFTMSSPDIMLDLFIRKTYRERNPGHGILEIYIIQPITGAKLRDLIIRTFQNLNKPENFGPAVKTAEDVNRVVLDMLEIGLLGDNARIDRKEAEAMVLELRAKKKI